MSSGEVTREAALFHRYLREHRAHGALARAIRARVQLDDDTAERLFEELLAVVRRYDAAPGSDTTTVDLRVFYLPSGDS